MWHEQSEQLVKLSKELLTAMDQYSFFCDGYRNGSASISEATHAGNELDEAKSKLWQFLKDNNL